MVYGQPISGTSAMAGTGSVRRSAWRHVVALLFAATGLLVSCSGSGDAYEDALSLVAENAPGSDPDLVDDADSDLHDLGRAELRDGPAVRHLGVARQLGEGGLIELLDSYFVNVPIGAYFLVNFELQAAMSVSRLLHGGADAEAGLLRDFERAVLIAFDGDALNRAPAPTGVDLLHDAFSRCLSSAVGSRRGPM
ncbi:hypothetical protein [Candidatus Poriferisodalis sp.]|uniref:hypothetical protein n=1 Tax=Candidatus Poriferisodalis sp. TaxID=3101277 RepID=UPI003B012DC3